MRKHLLAMAFESMATLAEVPSTVTGAATDALAPTNAPSGDAETVVMQGPLSTIFSQALNIAFAKPDPISGVAVESQATDQITGVAALLAEQASKEAGAEGSEPSVKVFSYVTTLKDEEIPEPVAVVRDLSRLANSVPTNFIFYEDCTQPTDDGVLSGSQTKLLPVVESIEIVVKVRHIAKP